MFFSKLFANIKEGLKDHWKKVSIPNKDKPEGTITFDHEGRVVEIENVKIVKKPEAKPEVKPKPVVVEPVVEPVVVVEPTPVLVPPAPVIDAVAVTPKANTVVEAPKQIDTANNTISGLVKGIMESFKK